MHILHWNCDLNPKAEICIRSLMYQCWVSEDKIFIHWVVEVGICSREAFSGHTEDQMLWNTTSMFSESLPRLDLWAGRSLLHLTVKYQGPVCVLNPILPLLKFLPNSSLEDGSAYSNFLKNLSDGCCPLFFLSTLIRALIQCFEVSALGLPLVWVGSFLRRVLWSQIIRWSFCTSHNSIKYSLGMRERMILQLCESSRRQRHEPHLCSLSFPSHYLIFNCFIPSMKTSGEKLEKTLSSFKNYDALPN